MLKEFKEFIMRGNVVDLAVAVVIGAAFTAVITSLVNNLINPLIGVFMGGNDLSEYFYVYGGGNYTTLAEAQETGLAVFAYGAFIMSIINFLIVAFVVFMLVKAINTIQKAKEEAPAGPSEIDILTEIRDALKK